MAKFLLASIVALCLCTAGAAYAQSTTKAAPSLTEKDYAEARYAINKKTMVDAYQKVGARDPKWDKIAVDILEKISLSNAYGGLDSMTPAPEVIDLREMREQLWAADRAKCDDPLITYLRLRHAQVTHFGNYAEVGYPKVIPIFVDSHYHPVRVRVALNFALQMPVDELNKNVRKDWEEDFVDLSVICAQEQNIKDLGPLAERYVLEGMSDSLDSLPLALSEKIVNRLEKDPKVHPYVRDAYIGHYHLLKAWQSRGSGWASEVTPEGWKGFHAHLKLSRTYLTRAWQKYPQHPEAPTKLITVTMADGNEEDGTPRAWFNRARQTQIDYTPAYEAYTYTLLPRWGGSTAAMYAFAQECLKSDRFDTSIPANFLGVMYQIAGDTENADHWRRPGAYAGLLRLVAKYGDATSNPRSRHYLYSYWAAVAAYLDKYQDAVKAFDILKGDYRYSTFAVFGIQPAFTEQKCRALATASGARILKADALAKKPGPATAAKEFAEILASLTPDDSARPYVRRRLFETENAEKLDAGEWVPVQPSKDLGPWVVDAGKWHVDDKGNLIGESDRRGLRAVLGFDLGLKYEIRGRVTQTRGPKFGRACPGPLVALVRKDWQVWVEVEQQYNLLYIVHNSYFTRSVETPMKGQHEFCGAAFGLDALAGLDGVYLIRAKDFLPTLGAKEQMFVGVGTRWEEPGQVVQFSDLRIRKLKELPPIDRLRVDN